MLDVLRALILGVVQGLTEFLPVSSSGHLEIARYLLNDDSTAELGLLMSVVLHFGTALATVFIFREDISRIISQALLNEKSSIKFIGWIIVSMIPAALVGVFFDDILEHLFNKNLVLVGSMLLITAILLWLSDKEHRSVRELNFSNAFIIGLAQAFAILPGVSRSGATISTALFLKIPRADAARFSFLMVVPLIFGKILKDLFSGSLSNSDLNFWALGVGFLAAFISGALACLWMIRIVKRAKLRYFAFYCVAVGLLAIGIQYL
jgi:undecaprenyl-diphosphatase